MSSELAYYDQHDLWGQEPAVYQINVRQDILDLLPDDARTIADIGCGDGIITNALPADRQVIGVDISAQALQYVRREKLIGSITSLPLRRGSYDLVLATDVIEHIPDADFPVALGELVRVATRYVLIAVPFMENLAASETLCAACGRRFHVNHHHRAFGVAELSAVLPEPWRPVLFVFSGEDVPPLEIAQRSLRAELGIPTSWDKAVCPHCSARASHPFLDPASLASVTRLAQRLPGFGLLRHPTRNECIVLFTNAPARPANPQADSLRLVLKTAHGCQTAAASLAMQDGQLVVHPDAPIANAELAAIDWTINSRTYRLPRLVCDGDRIQIPLWFTPSELPRLTSASHGFPGLERVSPTMLLAISAAAERDPRFDADAMKLRVGQAEQLAVDLQNARAELDALKLRLGQAEQLAIDLQNARAELDALKLRLGGSDQRTVDRQNARAELDALQSRLGQAGQLAVDLQSARAQLDVLQPRLAQVQQKNLDLTDAKAEVRSLHKQLQGLSRELGQAQQRATDLAEELERRRRSISRRVYDRLKSARPWRLWRGGWRSREDYRQSVLAQANPSVRDDSWDDRRVGRPSFVMICHDQEIDRRIVQEAGALQEAGWAGIIVALAFKGEDSIDAVGGVPLHRIGLHRIVPDCPVYWQYQNRQRVIVNFGRLPRLLSKFNWLLYRRQLRQAYHGTTIDCPLPFDHAFYAAARLYRADLVQAHDLPALATACRLADEWRVPAVYDAHELYYEQQAFSQTQQKILREAEHRNIGRCAATFTVNGSIAREMAKRYDCPCPNVLLNAIDPADGFDPSASHQRLRRHFHLPGDVPILLFQGGLIQRRNLENLTRAAHLLRHPNAVLVFMGNGPLQPQLKQLAEQGPARGRVLFKEAVAQDEVIDWAASADVGIIPYPHVDLNTYYCTPNKLFEYIQAGLPILANDLPELRNYVKETGFGRTADMSDPAAIAAAIDAFLDDPASLGAARVAVVERRGEFSWAHAKQDYVSIVTSVLANQPVGSVA